MNHKPIQFKDLGLSFTHKTCFSAFSGQILYGDKIAIVGRNGSGKSALLQILLGIRPHDGCMSLSQDLITGYVPQVIDDFSESSGGERINQALTKALALNPNCLLMDEPSNHLDNHNRRSLIRLLQNYPGTLLLVSHDSELINTCTNIIWHIESPNIHLFSGSFIDYQENLARQRASVEQELSILNRQQQQTHQALMQEQARAKNARKKGEASIKNRKWPTIVSSTKASRSQETSGRKKQAIESKKQELSARLLELRLPEIITPKFNLQAANNLKTVITVREGGINYGTTCILKNIHFQAKAMERIAICGANGSGKSSLIKALLADRSITTTGEWILPKPSDIGYLDQHYANLSPDKTVLEMLTQVMPNKSHAELRLHLNTFLFRKNEEVQALVSELSGGEKARLSLALIAANPPALLILDELCNNLDYETKTHVQQVLLEFSGTLIVIAHDEDFLRSINIETRYQINQGMIHLVNQ